MILMEAVEPRRLYSSTGPDLAVTNWGCAIGDFEVGTRRIAISTFANYGDAPADSTVRLYLSTDQTLSNDDAFITSVDVSLPAGASTSPMFAVTWPANLSTGQYYPILIVDQDDTVAELDETNNTFVGAPVTLRTPAPSDDYVPQYESLTSQSLGANWWVPAPYVPGQLLSVALYLRGFDQAYHVPVTFYISTDDIAGNSDDVAIGSATAVRTLPGDGYASAALPLPTDLAPGTYHLVAIANGGTPFLGDSFDVVPNQTDLSVTSVSVPTGATAGSTQSIETTFSVVAPAPTPYNGLFNASFTLSSDDVIGNADDILLLNCPVFIAPSSSPQSLQLTSYLQLPANLPSGTYRLIVRADINNLTAETDETNNVLLSAPFDISGTETTPPESHATPRGTYNLCFYASKDQRLSKNDKLIFQRTIVVPAGEDGPDALQQALTLPAHVKLGTKQLIVVTSEADTTDDQKQVKVLSAKALRSTSQAAAESLSAAIRSIKPGPRPGTSRVTIRLTNNTDTLFSSTATLTLLTDSDSPETILSLNKHLKLKPGKHIDLTLTIHRPASTPLNVTVS